MAKNFPYFKFVVTEWLTGDIVYEEMDTQGLFVNICAIYWQRDGRLTIDDVNKRYKNPELLAKLTDGFLDVTDGEISIKFLDEQLANAAELSKTYAGNGAKGGRPKKSQENPQLSLANPLQSEKKQYKEDIIENKNEINKEEDSTGKPVTPIVGLISVREVKFKELLVPHVVEFGKEMVRAFFDYWREPNKSNTKMRWELEKTWDLNLRLKKWQNNQKVFKKEPVRPHYMDKTGNVQ
jgi:hypothetical protein